MIRLTLLLIAAIAITFSVAGQSPNTEQGSDGGMDVARADTDLTDSGLLALDDEAGAIERAMAATNTFEASDMVDMAQEIALVQPATTSTAAPQSIAASDAPIAFVNATRVNLRSGPSTGTSVLDQATRNQQVQIVERTANGGIAVRIGGANPRRG